VTDICACGHERDLHEHYRRGTDCALCDCTAFDPDGLNPARAILASTLVGLLCVLAVVILVGLLPTPAFGAGPIAAHGGRTPCRTIACYRKAVAWQRHRYAREHLIVVRQTRRDAYYAIRIASAAFGVDARAMRSVAWCESRMGAQTTAEAGSGASGLFQFLGSTWRHTPFATFDVFDPLPNALAAAQIVAHDGGWGQWTCQP
jgi:hypothetical protein